MAKRDFYACFSEKMEPKKFNNTVLGINSFLNHLKKIKYNLSNTIIGVESTGSYHLRLCLQCTRADFEIKIINPLIVKKQNQVDLRRVKNDKKDSFLVRYCLVRGAGYIFSDSADSLTLKNLIRQRNSLSISKRRVGRQKEDIEYKEDCIGDDINSIYGDIYEILEQKIIEIEKELLGHRRDEQKLLQSIPGVEPITAISFISEIGDINRFDCPEKLVAYIGIDPRTHESGTSVRGKGYITKRGNKILRTILFNASSVAVQRPNIFKTFFDKKVSEGKRYRVALVAVMRKMTHVIYSIWRSGKEFEER